MTATCESCGADLNRHNITGVCAECKLTTRTARQSGTEPAPHTPVPLHAAIAVLSRDLGARPVNPPNPRQTNRSRRTTAARRCDNPGAPAPGTE
jgi:hypothetical protein